MQRPALANNEIYHIYNRGVEKRKVFLEDKDYFRFIHDLYEFNDTQPALASNVRFSIDRPSQIQTHHLQQTLEVRLPKFEQQTKTRKPREFLVHLFAFCLMPNHYHLLLRQKKEGGVSKFMQKLGTGYTNYFNEKNERVGPLFQGKFKAVHIQSDAHFTYLPHYIHLNPLDTKESKWRDGKITNTRQAIKYLLDYRWSSFSDYAGQPNFPSVSQREFLTNFLGNPKQYRQETWHLLKEMNHSKLHNYTLE